MHPAHIIVTINGLFEDAEPMTTSGVGRYSFIYDMHGNVVKKFDNEANVYYVLEYDADNKLVYAEKYVNDSLELKAKYTYDGLGRRVEKEVSKGGTVTRKSYVYNGENILLEYNTTAAPIETARYIGTGGIDDNLMTIRSGKGYFYHKDHLGSVTAITNDAGEVIQKNQYSAFGKVVSIKDKDRRELGVAKALDQPFYYTGREWDEEIELYYYRARSYDPALGRFLTFDPIGLKGGDTNLYRFVENNPVNFSDPSGNCPWCVGAGIGAVIGGVSGYYNTGTWQGAAIGAGAGALSGTTFGSGVIAGAFIGGFANLTGQYMKGATLSTVDLESFGLSVVAGGTGAASGIVAAKYLQVPFQTIGRPLTSPAALSNNIISSGIGGVVGSGIDNLNNSCK